MKKKDAKSRHNDATDVDFYWTLLRLLWLSSPALGQSMNWWHNIRWCFSPPPLQTPVSLFISLLHRIRLILFNLWLICIFLISSLVVEVKEDSHVARSIACVSLLCVTVTPPSVPHSLSTCGRGAAVKQANGPPISESARLRRRAEIKMLPRPSSKSTALSYHLLGISKRHGTR